MDFLTLYTVSPHIILSLVFEHISFPKNLKLELARFEKQNTPLSFGPPSKAIPPKYNNVTSACLEDSGRVKDRVCAGWQVRR